MRSSDSPLKKALLAIGFADKEANVYLGLLGLGRGTVSQIARKAGINRTTGYDILDTLVNKGFASISGKEPKQEYAAEPPSKILSYYQDQVAKNESHLQLAKNLVPELTSLHSVADRPQVRFYEGQDGLREVYEDTLSSHETIRAFANPREGQQSIPNYFPKYYQRRAQKGIHIRAIFPSDEAAIDRSSKDAEEFRESMLVPIDKYYFSPEINVYDNKVMIASWKEVLGVVIESKEIADAMKKIFELAWGEAKRLDQTLVRSGQSGGDN